MNYSQSSKAIGPKRTNRLLDSLRLQLAPILSRPVLLPALAAHRDFMTTPPFFDLRYYAERRANCETWNWYDLDDFVEVGFTAERAQEWREADIIPSHAEQFQNFGFCPREA